MSILVRKIFKNKRNNQFSITLPKKLLDGDNQFFKQKKKKVKIKIMGFE